MFEDLDLVYGSVRILQVCSLLYEHTWRSNLYLTLGTFLAFTQFYYMFRTNEGIHTIIKNSFTHVLWFNSVLRLYVLLYDRKKYEELLNDLERFYNELKESKETYIRDLLVEVNASGKKMARANLVLGFLTCCAITFYPLIASERALPFGSMMPGADIYESPLYECFYVYHVVLLFLGYFTYIPYTSLIVAFIMFGIVMCKVLQFRLKILRRMGTDGCSDLEINKTITECIQYQLRLFDYIKCVNALTTYVFLVEFLAFGTLLCALLFMLITVKSFGRRVLACTNIIMTLAQILALYWYANELSEQNLAIASAAFDTDWFTFPTSTQKHIILIIARSQKPPAIMMGHIYPITLQLFQKLLNASYTFFTLLRRMYT